MEMESNLEKGEPPGPSGVGEPGGSGEGAGIGGELGAGVGEAAANDVADWKDKEEVEEIQEQRKILMELLSKHQVCTVFQGALKI